MKIALVYDRVNKFGGAERVLMALHEIWPKAPLFTSVYDQKRAGWAKDFQVIPSFLQKISFARSHHEVLAPLMPLAFESFNFDEYDLVISVTSEAAKGIVTKPKTLHLCYCLTPTRYLWSGYDDYFSKPVPRSGIPLCGTSQLVSKPAISYLRKWDQVAAQRPDHYLAISKVVQKRIKKYYQRDSEVVYPPVDTKKFKVQGLKFKGNTTYHIPHTTYFLIVSRLVKYKRIDIAIEAFNQLGWSLKIIGTGSEMGKLKQMAKSNIEFLGQLTDGQLIDYYGNCQAVIFPQEEDFGLVPLEAQACGKPVIAYKAGGAMETVIPDKTGSFFSPQTSGALIKVLKDFKSKQYLPKDCREQAEKFNKEKFKENFKKLALKYYQQHGKN